MKNKLNLILLYIIIVGAILTSCEKEPLKINNDQYSLNAESLNQEIANFRSKMIDVRKSDNTETYLFEEAIWMLEATLNCYHSFSDENYSSITSDSIILPVEYNNTDIITEP